MRSSSEKQGKNVLGKDFFLAGENRIFISSSRSEII
jgi:hypothetical protein